MTKVRFIYEGSDYNKEREIVATKVCDFLRTQLDLPETIEVKFAVLDESLYGTTHINSRFKNRININNSLTFNDIPQVLVHELIHLEQVKSGRLSGSSDGNYYWDNKYYDLSYYPNYDELPWEKDVAERQQSLLVKTYQHFAPVA